MDTAPAGLVQVVDVEYTVSVAPPVLSVPHVYAFVVWSKRSLLEAAVSQSGMVAATQFVPLLTQATLFAGVVDVAFPPCENGQTPVTVEVVCVWPGSALAEFVSL